MTRQGTSCHIMGPPKAGWSFFCHREGPQIIFLYFLSLLSCFSPAWRWGEQIWLTAHLWLISQVFLRVSPFNMTLWKPFVFASGLFLSLHGVCSSDIYSISDSVFPIDSASRWATDTQNRGCLVKCDFQVNTELFFSVRIWSSNLTGSLVFYSATHPQHWERRIVTRVIGMWGAGVWGARSSHTSSPPFPCRRSCPSSPLSWCWGLQALSPSWSHTRQAGSSYWSGPWHLPASVCAIFHLL